MCTPGCLEFIASQLSSARVLNKNVLEVGSCDINGTVRGSVLKHRPATFLGVDIASGPGVDRICSATDLLETFGANSFDLVISTEMLEHVRDWHSVIHNLKGVLRPGGYLLLTTRSRGFPFHGYPLDFWRFEIKDFERIFSDLRVVSLEKDVSDSPGVFVAAEMPNPFVERVSNDDRVYSIVRRRPARTVTRADVAASHGLCLVHSAVVRTLPTSSRRTARVVRRRILGK
jgi:SAM-dependent methyltransferase